MCFSQYTEYVPRPVREEVATEVVRPEGAPLSAAELDDNLYGPKPTPPEWTVVQTPENGHTHTHAEVSPQVAVQAIGSQANGSTAIASVSTQTVEAVVVELANGTKLLICPLD